MGHEVLNARWAKTATETINRATEQWNQAHPRKRPISVVTMSQSNDENPLPTVSLPKAFRIADGPFASSDLYRWSDQVRQEYRDSLNSSDRAPALLEGCIDITAFGLDGSLCFSCENLVGMLIYRANEIFPFFRIISIAVAPRFQRNGLGKAVINHLKRKAIARDFYITVGDVLEPAIGCLQKAGFRLAGTSNESSIYKWNHRLEHANDDFPGKCDGEPPAGQTQLA